jgi:hypothetical protein
MASHRLFCSLDQLEEVLLYKEDYQTLSNIIENFCDVVLDLTHDELLSIIKTNPILKMLFKREDSTLISDKIAYSSFTNKEFNNFLNDILILDIEEKHTKRIRDEYGILAINLKESFLEEQNYHHGYSIGTSSTSLKECWSELFKDSTIEPINSAIIIDNFLWSQISLYPEDNMYNIYPILKAIIPKKLKTPFHLKIILQNKDGRLERKKAKPIISKMKKAIKKDIGVDIEISIATQTDTKIFHERVILTNYHYIYSDKGFVCFKNRREIKKTNGTRNWVFKDINNFRGEIDKHRHIANSRNVYNLIKLNYKEDENESDTIFYQGEVLSPILSNFT